MLEMPAARAGRIGQVAEVQVVRCVGQEVAERAAEVQQGVRISRRERDDDVLIIGAVGARRRIASCGRRGASSRTTCALVPPNPNELTPASGRPLGRRARARAPRGTRSGRASRWICGFGREKWRLAGIARWCSASAALISPAMPAAASRWPMFVLTEPSRQRAPGVAALAEHGARARRLDRIAERRAGAVGLDVIHLPRARRRRAGRPRGGPPPAPAGSGPSGRWCGRPG